MGTAARRWASLALASATAIVLLLSGSATAALPDNAFQFNGSNQHVTFGSAAGTGAGGLGATRFTLETWFKKTGAGVTTSTGSGGLTLTTAAIPLVTKGGAQADTPANLNMNYFLGIVGATGKLAADFEDTATGLNHPIIGTTPITDNVWHHAAATYDGTTWRLYLNGVLDGMLVVGSFTPESTSIQHAGLATSMNSGGTASGRFQGELDEARIWSHPRTGAEIRSNKNTEIEGASTGLLGRWGFDNGTANDSSGRNIHGTLVNGPTPVTGEYAFPPDTTPPGVVQSLAASSGNEAAALTWSANGESDLAGYNVYRALSTPVPTDGLPLNGTDLLTPTTLSFNDTGLTNGTTYYYAVVAVDGSHNFSPNAEVIAAPAGPPPPSNALQFGGSNYVTFGEATSKLGATDFTLEGWIRRTAAGVGTSTGAGGIASAVPLITKGRAEQETPANVNMNYFLGIDATSGVLVADFEDTAGGVNHPVSGATAVPADSVWHHVAVTYDGQTWRVYLDGKLDAKSILLSPFTPESTSTQHAGLGTAMTSIGAAAGFFAGQMDEVRVWDVARSGADIRASKDDEINDHPNLLGRWGMNQSTGHLADSAGSGSNSGWRLPVGSGPSFVAGYGFPQDLTPPGPVQGLTATPGDTTVNLGWNANVAPDLAGYDVYRSLSTPVGTSDPPLNGDDLLRTNSFNDTGLTNGITYYYAVVAVDGSNNPSTPSETSATPSGGPSDPVFVGAGDIAGDWPGAAGSESDDGTAALVAGIPGQVFTIGDNVYPDGTASEFATYYTPTWGVASIRNRTRPAIGNHDFGNGINPESVVAKPYYDYFNGPNDENGPVAGPRGLGYYSYDLTGNGVTWHVVVLNSECEPSGGDWLPGGCAAGSTQELWLRDDLENASNASTNNIIAIWHKPRWSSTGTGTGNHTHMQALWQALYDYGVDIALGGHWHNYERLQPMDADGVADSTYGIREFVVGTGGAGLTGFGTDQPLPTSEVRNSTTHGVIKFTLHASSYDWQFVPIAGQTFTDSGTNHPVHGPPPDATAPTVNVVSAVPSSLGPSDSSTDITWNATENGTYSVRVGGTTCATGTEVANGSYTTSPANVVTNILASSLAEGQNTIRVCLTDAGTNTGSDTIVVSKNSTPPTNALSFDGSDDHVTFGQATTSLGASQLTLETWFMRTGTCVSPAPCGTGTGSGGLAHAVPLVTKGRSEMDTPANLNMNYFLGIDTATNALAADFEDTANGQNHPIIGSTPVTGSGWHHAAATYDGTTWRLYLDGRRDAKLLVGGFTPESASGQHAALASALDSGGNPSGFFQGLLDEARVWDVARSGAEIRQGKDDEIVDHADLLGRWGMNQSSGALDDSAGSNTGTLLPAGSGPTYVAGYAFPQDTTDPAAPTGLAATPGDTQASLTWNTGGAEVAGYDLYRSTSSPVSIAGTPVNGDDLITDTAYTDSNLTNNTPYYYVLVAVDGSDNRSGPSAETSTTPVPGDPVLVGAGDIAGDWPGTPPNESDDATAALVAGIPGQVFTIGDNVYPDGTAAEFGLYYSPTWGVPAIKDRTRPTIGNHDFGNGATANATPYYDYFNGTPGLNGPAGERGLGYYSYNVGSGASTWHVVVLNSECEPVTGFWVPGGCAENSPQDLWLKGDLASAPTNNVIAMFHKPRFSSAGSFGHMQQLWKRLYEAGADIVLGGHWHVYERLQPMNLLGEHDPNFGIRQFVVGTGGAGLSGFGAPLGTSEVRNNATHGVIKFTLHESSYDWQFIPIAGQTFTDSNLDPHPVHGPPPDTTPPAVTVVSAVPSSLGPSDTSTDITWNANENGSYSIRVGGSTCANGTEVASGSYTTSPANLVTNVLASSLAEGPNTIRVCVTDASTNTGSATTTVNKDAAAPTVTIVSALPSTVGASGSTNVTWNASENGTYSVRVGGADCGDGTQVATGSYTTPGNLVTNVLASALAEGPNTIRVCVTDASTNTGSATTSVSKDSAGPTVTINQADAQADPTSASPIAFTVVFSEPVTGFAGNDVSFTGSTVGGTLAVSISGSGPNYTVSVSGMSGNGTVVASIPSASASDLDGNPSTASTSTDNSVTFNTGAAPTVTINQAPAQVDPTSTPPIRFRIVFSEVVSGFAVSDVSLAGSTVGGTLTINLSGSGPSYTIAVRGMTGSGTVVASIPAGAATNSSGNPSAASTSTDNTVTFTSDTTAPTVTVDQSSTQADPTSTAPIRFTVAFSESVTGFAANDVSFAGSGVGGTLAAAVTGSGANYTVSVTGMSGSGTVVASIPAGAASDPSGNPSTASTSVDNTVSFIADGTSPAVTIDQAATQADPASASPIVFTVVFSEPVTGFAGADISFAGSTAPGTLTASVSGSGANYTVSVTGMSGSGTVVVSIPSGAAVDSGGNGNLASTSTDNTVTFNFSSSPAPTCNGVTATIYVGADGRVVGGPRNGQPHNGTLPGTAAADVIVGTSGNDTVEGRGGADLICGLDGNDTLRGGAGNDVVVGGTGNDIVAGGGGADTLTGNLGADQFRGDAGQDQATDYRPAEGDTVVAVETF